uniref:BACK domain-containing protein n=1 Tax=Panagrolaimus sp. PS1159 TaxID=55785 RepID=A0AC35FM88_9BILA
MAEFYTVPFLKELCENFLLGIEYNVESIEEMFEFSQKYSMKNMEDLIKKFVSSNFEKIISSESLLSYKKPFMDVLASVIHYPWKEKTFEAIYKWVEHHVITQNDTEDESFSLLEAVKTELREKFPQIYSIDKTGFNYEFLLNFIVVKGFCMSQTEFKTLYETYAFCGGQRFQRLWRLAEKQAIVMKKVTHDQSFSVADSIKADLVIIIPNLEYYKMDRKFLMESLVPAGILTEEQASHVYDTRVTIENNGKVIAGIFDDNIGVLRRIQDKSCNDKRKNTNIARFLKFKFAIPSSPSTVKKMKGIDWYLCLDNDGVITLKHHSVIDRNDYILAEMKSQNEFFLTPDVKTNLTVCVNNIKPIL